jgi:hypothetical protein
VVQGESACKPASVPRDRGGGHPSGTGVAAGLVRSTRGLGRASLRGRVAAAGASPIRPCSGWGLPSRPVTRPLVRSYRTVSPLPSRLRRAAVCSLWHCPAGRPDWRLASTLPCGGRTFLDPGEPGPRPPSRLPLHLSSMPPEAGPTEAYWVHGSYPGYRVHPGPAGRAGGADRGGRPHRAAADAGPAAGGQRGRGLAVQAGGPGRLAAVPARPGRWPGADRRGGRRRHDPARRGVAADARVPHRRGRCPAVAASDPGAGPAVGSPPGRAPAAPPPRPGRDRRRHRPPRRLQWGQAEVADRPAPPDREPYA